MEFAPPLASLRARVDGDLELARRLRSIDPDAFPGAVARFAAELGCDVMAGELAHAVAHRAQAWSLRWIL